MSPARTVYLDPVSGNDADDGLSCISPVQRWSRAFAVAASQAPTCQAMTLILVGAGQPPAEAGPLNIPANVQIFGCGAAVSTAPASLKFDGATTEAAEIGMTGICMSELAIDLRNAPNVAATIRDCRIHDGTFLSPNDGDDQITIWNSYLLAAIFQGSVLASSCVGGNVAVRDGSAVTYSGGQISGNLDLSGASTTTLLGVDTFSATSGTFTVSGRAVAASKPTLCSDSASIHAATIAGFVTVVNL